MENLNNELNSEVQKNSAEQSIDHSYREMLCTTFNEGLTDDESIVKAAKILNSFSFARLVLGQDEGDYDFEYLLSISGANEKLRKRVLSTYFEEKEKTENNLQKYVKIR